MELTQKLECTQDLYASAIEKEFPEQIGFLGICGIKYPLKKGPNKIGRDPDTCNIVLNLNSISRQHAVINILNSNDFMLMDLDSANKTKLADKTLQAYIPSPLKNGDMVQFGQVFGVFRLFVEDNDLPMTQALDIPETPVRNHVSKLNLITTIPESPEVSDRDDSFIVASQPKSSKVFKSPGTNFIKPSGKTITIKPVGSNRIDNVYWSTSKKSDSFTLESDTSMSTDTSLPISKTKENIHEQDTQLHNNTNNFIHEADTQVGNTVPSIFNSETQMPKVDNLPEVHKVHGQENINIDLFAENKEKDNNIYNSETQDVSLLTGNDEESKNLDRSSNKNDVSDDIILFDEIEGEENFESQPLLLPELETIDHIEPINEGNIEISEKQPQNIPVSDRRDSNSSTDCEDIKFALTQKIPERRTNDDDDTTDCEDAPELTNQLNTHKAGNSNIDDNLTDCEDEIILENLPTQIIDDIPSDCNIRPTISKDITSLEDLQTQIIDEDKNCWKENTRDQLDLEDVTTQILHQESRNIISDRVTPFKVPVTSPFKRKRKDKTEEIPNKEVIANKNITEDDSMDEKEYYAATQELLNDLLTQRELSPEIVSFAGTSNNVCKVSTDNNHTNSRYPTDFKITEDIDEKIDKFVMNLTNSVIKDVNVEKEVPPLKNASSSSSDLESTPKKLQPLSFLETKLPNTQEIKNYLKLSGYASTESSKESDTDCSNVDSPYIHRKTNRKVVKRVDLTSKFEGEGLQRNYKQYYKDSNKILQSRSYDTDQSREKETVALSSTSTSNINEKLKKKTIKTDKKNRQEINKSREKNKSKENRKNRGDIKCLENNKSKENNKIQAIDGRKDNNKIPQNVKNKESNTILEKKNIQENNKSKENNKSRENKKSKESNKRQANDGRKQNNKILENVKEINNTILEKKHVQENNKINRRVKNDHQNNNENSSLNKNKIEQKTTRKSSRTKDKQNEDRKEDERLKGEAMPLKNETANSIRKANGRSHSKTNRKESNTIDKYLSPTPTQVIQKDETKTTEKRSSRSKNKEPNREASIEIEVRRSKRQRTAKRSFDSIEPISKQIKPVNHEQSAVYNISSESGIDSPNKLKRQATNFHLPTAKKTKINIGSSNVVLRSTPSRKIKTHYILFTAFPCEEVRVKLEKLGAVVVSDIMQCTVVLTLQIKRTFKLLCAVGLGKPIVGPSWVQACVDTNMIVDPWLYLIKDELTEKRFQFNLERVLLGNRQFLKGYNVSSTPNIMPSPPEMKLIVECSGGTWNNGGRNWICVSSSTDKPLWTSLKRKGATIVSTEFILGGVLRQAVDIKKNTLA